MFLSIKLYSCLTELFEIEMFIYIKMDLALYNLQRLICHKTETKKKILIGLVGRVFADGPGDLSSIPGRVIPKTFKMVLDT